MSLMKSVSIFKIAFSKCDHTLKHPHLYGAKVDVCKGEGFTAIISTQSKILLSNWESPLIHSLKISKNTNCQV